MDWSVGSPRTWSVVGVRGPGVSVFGSPSLNSTSINLNSTSVSLNGASVSLNSSSVSLNITDLKVVSSQ